METSSALLALCAGNSKVTGEFPSQRPVTWSFGVFFDLRLNEAGDLRRHRAHYDVILMQMNFLCTGVLHSLIQLPMNWIIAPGQTVLVRHPQRIISQTVRSRGDPSVHAPSQWVATLHCNVSIADEMDILQSCTKPSICNTLGTITLFSVWLN